MELPTINTPRQLRVIKELFNSKKVSCFELKSKAGVRNAPELIATLRRLGWEIICTREAVKDRDGHKCRLGYYSLTELSRLRANEVKKVFLHSIAYLYGWQIRLISEA